MVNTQNVTIMLLPFPLHSRQLNDTVPFCQLSLHSDIVKPLITCFTFNHIVQGLWHLARTVYTGMVATLQILV